MTDMIKKLVDIDEQAKLLSRETEKEKERLARELEAEKKEVYDRYMLDAEKRAGSESGKLREEAAKAFEKKEQQRAKALDELNEKYSDLTVLRGIELGEPLQAPEQTSIALNLCEYDFILCSLHNIANEEDFYFLHPDRQQAQELIRRYFDELLETVRWNRFDSLAHFTYPLRYITDRDGVQVDMARYQPVIREILATLAANGKALEINTSGLRSPTGFLLPTVEYIREFRELGGRYITLGSDAHVPEHMAVGMSEGIAAAKQAGFDCATVFINRQPVEIPL